MRKKIFSFVEIKFELMSKMDDAIIAILEKRLELSQLTYADEKYDDIEEELHDLEDDFNDEYGTELENQLDSIHDQYCPKSDVLLPTAYLAKNFAVDADGNVSISPEDGVEVEWIKDPANGARLVLVPSPSRFLFISQEGIDEIVIREE